MRSNRSQLLYIPILLAFALIFFALGYVSYPLLHDAPATLPAADAPIAMEDPADLKIFWEAWHLLERDFYGEKPEAQKRVYGALHGLAQSFADPYTVFVEPQPREIEQDRLRGSFGGIGATIEQTEAGYVLHPQRDQPAARAGVQDGDLLVRVDEHPITATMSSDDVIALVRGPVDSQVEIGVRRPATAEELTFRIVRAEIHTPSIEWRLLDDDPETATVGYLRQTIFSERSPDEMRTALAELTAGGADRFILDLRGNPGGLVEAAVAISDLWLDGGLVLTERHADGSEKSFTAQPGTEVANAPLTVLIDGGTASASEIVAGALQAHGRAKLVGEKSFGKGSVQLVYELSDQSSLHVTNAQWLTPNGQQISGQGLTPDVVIEPGTDPLPQALAVLAQLAGEPPYAVAGRQ
jgi:carboxyl-terminal processing protease